MTAGLPLIKYVLTKNISILLGLSTGMSEADAAIQKQSHASGTTALTISNEEMEDAVKIVKLLKESRLLVKKIGETIKSKTNKQKGGFLPMLSGTLAASLLESALTVKRVTTSSFN